MPNYPKLIELDEDKRQALRIHLDSILLDHDAERGNYLTDLINWQKDYWAKPNTAQRDFPFKGAANIIIPLTAIVFETVHARTMQQAFSLPEIAAGKAINPEWEAAADPFVRYFNHELKHSVKFKKNIEPAVIEIEKLGTGCAYSCYEHLIKYGCREINGVEEEFPVTVKKGASVYSVPISRLIYPLSASDLETSPWVGEEHSDVPYMIQIYEQSEFFYPGIYDALKMWLSTVSAMNQGIQYEESQQTLENRKPAPFSSTVNWVEIWLAYPIKSNSDRLYEIVVHYHRESGVVMSVRHNWHEDLRRKYRVGVYFPVEHRINGVGIAKQNEQFQREVTTQHRQRLDNATLANMRMIKISKVSGYGPKEPIFPGKMWFLDDMTQLETIQMGEVYPSAYNNEQQTLMYSQQRTGVNEATLGMPQVGTPGTATSDLSRIQEGAKKFDYTYGNIKSFADEILLDVACDLHQFGPSSIDYFTNIEGGQLAAQVLQMPESLIRNGLIVELASAGAKNNKILDRQNWQAIMQVLQQYFAGIFQLVASQPNMMQPLIPKALAGATEAVKQYLETYDVRNVNRIIPMELLQYGIPAVGNALGNPQASGPGGMANVAGLLGTGATGQ